MGATGLLVIPCRLPTATLILILFLILFLILIPIPTERRALILWPTR